MTDADEDYDALSQRHLASIKHDMRVSLEVATVHAMHKVSEFAQAQEQAEPVWPFVVKHYIGERRPSIKGNGFDGLEVGANREDAEEFVAWVNAHIIAPPQRQWVGLTDVEIKSTWSQLWCDINKMKLAADDRPQKETVEFIFAKAYEAKLKEKNT